MGWKRHRGEGKRIITTTSTRWVHRTMRHFLMIRWSPGMGIFAKIAVVYCASVSLVVLSMLYYYQALDFNYNLKYSMSISTELRQRAVLSGQDTWNRSLNSLARLWNESLEGLPRIEIKIRNRWHWPFYSPSNPLVTRIEPHFNMTRIYTMQKISRNYFNPIRHVIDYRDLDAFRTNCNIKSFTMKNSTGENRKACDVVHTPIKHYRTCAVVGSGGILLNSSCGAEIDAHDFVIRSNLPPTIPFQKDVGRRTNFTAVNHARLMAVRKALKARNPAIRAAIFSRLSSSPGMVFSYSLTLADNKRNRRYLQSVYMIAKENKIPMIAAFSHQSYMSSKGLWSKMGGRRWTLPSTGLNVFGLATTFCDRISMYGYFPFPDVHGRPIPYHYYDGVRKPHSAHKMKGEFDMFQKLHHQGVLRHVVDKCDAAI
ncbi:CMP-N-acetylneuraminate-poly-alpha-2,8-sialyltransferase-like [Branchiostoma lanceolatum]|uniref:CMP-N-acetylneuraminate-poly-alpha-2, 8-sialyltransferase-like n=1 Tax=Branchiostoma lanceolatum TaxID=7740 RepID=UPI003455972A